MEFFDHVKFLGMYWGESALHSLIDPLGMNKSPKIPKGEETGFLLSKKYGIELTFKDEQFVKNPSKSFPEGAAVLCNIRLYLAEKDGFKPYAGVLPRGIRINATDRSEILEAFGVPSYPKYSKAGQLLPGENDRKMRWDRPGYVMFLTFNDAGNATSISLQLPLDQS